MFGKGQAPFAHSVDSSFSAKLLGWYIICPGLIISLFICVDVCIGVYVGGCVRERDTYAYMEAGGGHGVSCLFPFSFISLRPAL